VFLLDEPLSNLDARLRVALRREIAALHQAVRTTLVYVTHDQEEAMVLSDRVAVMHAGRVLQCAPPREIYSCPTDLTVAELVGTPMINLIDAEVQGTKLVLPGGVLMFIPVLQAERFVAAPRYLRLGVRPEHIHLAPDSGPGKGRVRQVEHLGKETHILLDCGTYTLTARVEADCTLRPGQTVTWTWGWEHVLCFDPHTGKNLHSEKNEAGPLSPVY
jgi:ABC-type sugar transport system ATPase subunit